ncbi:MAG: tripartite tricarboxylate transporter substrate binding protein, partial [Acidiferrobacterales bacterium]
MKTLLRSVTYTVLGVLLMAFGSVVAPQDAGAWEPKKPVDFVILAGKGGGADKMARLMQTI